MAHSVIERPAAFCMSKNEIRYVFRVTDLTRAGLYMEVQLFYRRSDSTVDSSFPAFKLVPNNDGTVILTIQQYIDGLLNYDMPSSGSLVTAAKRQSLVFWVHTRELEDSSSSSVGWNTIESSSKRVALKMGMENNRYSRNNLLNYITANYLFLTWQPSKRKVFDSQPLFLSFISKINSTLNCKLFYSIKTIQGTTLDGSVALNSSTGYVYHTAVDIATILTSASIALPSGETLHYYSVYIGNTSTSHIITAPYRFYKDYKPLYNFYDFIYVNSLGGIDTARAAGEVTVSVDRAFDVAEGGFNVNHWSDTVKAHALKQVNITLQRKWKGDIGFRQDKQEQLGLMDLLLCLRSYMIIDGNWVPLLSIQTSVDIHKTTDTKWGLPIEWQLAETNESYTPDYVALGMGSDTEEYNGAVVVTIKSLICNLHYVRNIEGFDLPNAYYNSHTDSPIYGTHTAGLVAGSISLFATVTGTATTAVLLVNGVTVETLTLPNESYIFFTSALVIARADIIEIIIN